MEIKSLDKELISWIFFKLSSPLENIFLLDWNLWVNKATIATPQMWSSLEVSKWWGDGLHYFVVNKATLRIVIIVAQTSTTAWFKIKVNLLWTLYCVNISQEIDLFGISWCSVIFLQSLFSLFIVIQSPPAVHTYSTLSSINVEVCHF